MNERIEKLANVWANLRAKDDRLGITYTFSEKALEQFAELILTECARIARATPCPYEEDEVRQRLGHTWDMASLEAGHEIVKHFGVDK
jgi:hypothetical protein